MKQSHGLRMLVAVAAAVAIIASLLLIPNGASGALVGTAGFAVVVIGWGGLLLPRGWRNPGIAFTTGLAVAGLVSGLSITIVGSAFVVGYAAIGLVGFVLRPVPLEKDWLLGALAGIPYVVLVKAIQPFPLGQSFGYLNYSWNALRMLDGTFVYEPTRHIPGVAALMAAQSGTTSSQPIEVLWSASIVLPLLFAAGVYVFIRTIGGGRLSALVAASVSPFLFAVPSFQHLHAFIQRSTILAATPWLATVAYQQASAGLRPKAILSRLAVPLMAGAVIVLPVKWLIPGTAGPLLLLLLLLVSLGIPQPYGGPLAVGLALAIGHQFEAPLAVLVVGIFLLLLAVRRRTLFAFIGIALGALVFGLQWAGIVNLGTSGFISEMLFGRETLLGITFEEKWSSISRAGTLPQLVALAILSSAALSSTKHRATALGLLGSLGVLVALVFTPFDVEDGMTRLVGYSLPFIGALIGLGLDAAFSWVRLNVPEGHGLRSTAVPLAVVSAVAVFALSLDGWRVLRAPAGQSDILSTLYEFEFDSADEVRDAGVDLVVSDPMTMFSIEGLTSIRGVAEQRRWIRIGEWDLADQQRFDELRDAWENASLAPHACGEAERVGSLHPVVLVTPRTEQWLLRQEPIEHFAVAAGVLSTDGRDLTAVQLGPPVVETANYAIFELLCPVASAQGGGA